MLSQKLLPFLLVLSGAGTAAAQQFTNGSFEAPTTPACQTVYNNQFHLFIPNAGYAFGTNTVPVPNLYGRIYFYDNSCGDGTAQQGGNFIALASNDQGTYDAISLRLSTPMQANKPYTVTFYHKKANNLVPVGLDIGYTTDSLTFGTQVGTAPMPSSFSWVMRSVTFTPTVAAKFITVRAQKSNTGSFDYGYTIIDNFRLSGGTAVSEERGAFAVAPFPNPFAEALRFTLDAGAQLPCRISLTDVTGRVALEQPCASRQVEIDRGTLPSGCYLLTVKDAAGTASYRRVMAQ